MSGIHSCRRLPILIVLLWYASISQCFQFSTETGPVIVFRSHRPDQRNIMSGTQAKIEKAAIDAKVAKVREVVRNVSNNDIVLALHNFDMDVNKTIHAFTDGECSAQLCMVPLAGVESALGDWEKNGAAAKKKKNKAKKAGANGTNSSAASTTTDTPKVSSVSAPIKPTTSAQPSVVPKSATVALPKLSSATEVERLVAELDKKHREVKALLDHAEAQKTLAIDAILNAVNARDRQLAGQLANVRQKAEKQAAQQRALLAQMKQKLARNESAASEMKSFAQGDAFLSEVVGGKFVFDEKPSIRSIDKFGSGRCSPCVLNTF